MRALLICFQTECVTALEHVDRTETEAKDIEFACLSRTLTIALTIDQLFVSAALCNDIEARFVASTIMVDHTFGANWCTNVALSDHEARRTLREPFGFAFLTVSALFLLTIASPEG